MMSVGEDADLDPQVEAMNVVRMSACKKERRTKGLGSARLSTSARTHSFRSTLSTPESKRSPNHTTLSSGPSFPLLPLTNLQAFLA